MRAPPLRPLELPFLLMTLWLLMIPACVLRGAPDRVGERGRAIYLDRCAVCHGPQGRGDGPEAPFLSPRPASLISAGTSVKSDAEFLAVIANGKPRTAMPAWKDRLSEEQRREVLAYIRSLIRFQPQSLTPPPPQERR
ncbi:MAG: c-type cytochrome [Nitrospiraceae bacterium]